MRQAFEDALSELASGSLGAKITLADLWAEMLLEDPLRSMEVLAKFVPRELYLEQESTVRIISGEPMAVEQWEAENLRGEAIEVGGEELH